MLYKTIFQSGNIKVFYPIEIKDINGLYSIFLDEKYDIYFPRNRIIEFSLFDFVSFNLLCDLKEENNILKIVESIGLPVHINYEQLIEQKYINCGFLEGINFCYYIYKFKYDTIKIDLPETHLHMNALFPLIKLIAARCKQLIIFTYSIQIYHYLPR